MLPNTEYRPFRLGLSVADLHEYVLLLQAPPQELSGRDHGRLLDLHHRVNAHMDDVSALGLEHAKAGRPPWGWVAEYGRKGRRLWAERNDVMARKIRMLGIAPYVERLITPTQLEKMHGRAALRPLNHLIRQDEPSVALVPRKAKGRAVRGPR